MINRMQLVNVAIVSMMAISAQAMTINNVNNVTKFEKNSGEAIYELAGNFTTEKTTKAHSVAEIVFAPNASSEPHYHYEGFEETYYVLSGKGIIIQQQFSENKDQVNPKEERVITKGDLVIIKGKFVHQVINHSSTEELRLLVTAAPAWTPDCMTPHDFK